MENLNSEIIRLIDNSLAVGTRKVYLKAWEDFDNFRGTFGFGCSWPAPYQHVAAFIANCTLEGLAPSTINCKISGISFRHKLCGWEDPSDNFLIRKLKEGYKRGNKSQDNRWPITQPILLRLIQMVEAICYNNYEALMFKAAFLIAYFGFLRVGEFTLKPQINSANIIALSDVQQVSGKVHLRIRVSKADQSGRGEVLIISQNPDVQICPVRAMAQYLTVRPKLEGPLFVHLQGNILTAAQFSALLKKVIKAIGLDPAHFSAHSFRIGAATSAAAKGIPLDQIMQMGRWHSNSVLSYIRPSREIVL